MIVGCYVVDACFSLGRKAVWGICTRPIKAASPHPALNVETGNERTLKNTFSPVTKNPIAIAHVLENDPSRRLSRHVKLQMQNVTIFTSIFNIFLFWFSAFWKTHFRLPPIVPSCNASATFLLPPFSCLNVSPAPPGVKFYIASKIVIDFYRFYDSSSGWIFPAFNVQSGPSSGEIFKKKYQIMPMWTASKLPQKDLHIVQN